MTCSSKCAFCKACCPTARGACPNPIHTKTACDRIIDEMCGLVNSIGAATPAANKPTAGIQLEPAVRDDTRTCVKCGKDISSGFTCPCGYDLCAEDAGVFARERGHCPNGHELIVKTGLEYCTCVVCGKPAIVRGCECECHFIVCLDCEKVAHQPGKCPNGHDTPWGKFDTLLTCFRCSKAASSGSTCETGYVLCLNCCLELRAEQVPELAKPDDGKVDARIQEKVEAKKEDAKKEDVPAGKDGEELVCKVCYKNKAEMVLRPCNHAGICAVCAQKVSTCPFCNLPIEGRERVFFQ